MPRPIAPALSIHPKSDGARSWFPEDAPPNRAGTGPRRISNKGPVRPHRTKRKRLSSAGDKGSDSMGDGGSGCSSCASSGTGGEGDSSSSDEDASSSGSFGSTSAALSISQYNPPLRLGLNRRDRGTYFPIPEQPHFPIPLPKRAARLFPLLLATLGL